MREIEFSSWRLKKIRYQLIGNEEKDGDGSRHFPPEPIIPKRNFTKDEYSFEEPVIVDHPTIDRAQGIKV